MPRSRFAAVTLVLWIVSTPASAQDQKGWVDVNLGAASAAEDTHTSKKDVTVSFETATFQSQYFFPTGASFDAGGGYMLTPVLGAGISVTGTAHEDFPALTIRIPHPLFFNASGTSTSDGDTAIARSEGTINIQAMVNVTPLSNRLRVRAFAGPSFVRIKQDVVDDIEYAQTFGLVTPTNVVSVTSYKLGSTEGTAWGFHAGADVSCFFGRVIGVGGFIRVIRATIQLEDFSGTYDVKAGGVQYGGGLRLRF